MNRIKKTLKKITAIILTMVIVVFNIPMESLYATDNTSSSEEVTVKITVVDKNDIPIENASFAVNGDNSIVSSGAFDEIKNEYTLVMNKVESDLLITVTAEDDVEISGERYYQTYTDVIEYNGAEEYTATLKKYADLSNNELEFINGVYTLDDVMYNASRPDDNNYIISFPYEVECEIEVEDEGAEDNPEISKVDNSYNWMLEYNRPGEYIVKISSVDDSVQFEDTEFRLTVGNELKFLYEDNKELDNDKVDFAVEDGEIKKVKKIISSEDETFKLALSGLYTEDISYFLNEGAKSTIDNEGIVDICACETIIVTAVCNITGVETSYELTIEPEDKDMTLFDDENGNGEKDEEERYISDVSRPIEFNALEDIGDTIKLNPHMDNSDWWTVEYSSSNENVATVDSNNGRVTVKGVGETTIQVTARSTYCYWWSWSPASYTVKVNAAEVVPVIFDDREDVRLNQGDILHLKDMSDNAGETTADVTIDADTNKEILKLPLDIELFYEVNGEEKKVDISEDEINIDITSDGLDIEDYTITNVDDVVRNEAFDVNIIISDSKGRFESTTSTIKVLLESSRTNNKDEADNEYYFVESGLKTGLDGKTLWKIDEETGVFVKGNTINEGTEEEYTYQIGALAVEDEVDDEYYVLCGLLEQYNKAHKIFVKISGTRFEPTWLYFGVDYEAPTCNPETDIEYTSESISETSYGILSNGSVTVTIKANDNGRNIFDAILYDGEREIAKLTPVIAENGEGTFTYTFDKNTYKGCNDNLRFVLRDLAGNTKEYEIDTIVIDENAPLANADVAEQEGLQSWKDKTNKEYFSKDVVLNVLVTDLLDSENNSIELPSSSGIKSYDVYVNDTKIDDLSVSNLSESEKCSEKPFTIDTSRYSKKEDGSITIKICNIVDMAGNVNTEGYIRTIYIDNEKPTAAFATVNTDGKENRTEFGNFYNNKVTYVFNAKDNMTDIKSAVVMIGDKICNTSLDNGKVTAVVDLNACGNVKLTITDSVGHTTEYKLSDIKDATDNKVFASDYVLTDNRGVDVSFDNIRATDKGNWYKSDVAYTLNISDVYKNSLTSGIANVKVTINGKIYEEKAYVGKDNTKDVLKVNINKSLIDEVINANGSYTVSVTVTDNAGNVKTYNKTVYIDTVAPVISDLTGVANGSVNTGVATVNVEVFEKHFNQSGNGVTVSVKKTLDGVTTDYAVDKFASASAKTTKAYAFREDGTYTVVVSSEDAAGNKAVDKSITFTVDNTAPLVDITGVKENTYYTESKDVTVGIIESNYADMDVVISITRELNGNVTVLNSQVFNKTGKESSLTQKFAEEGTYTIKVDAVDAAGNVAITRTVIFTVDTKAPTIEITGIADGAAYKDEFIPKIKVNDTYYKNYDISLVKTGVYFDDTKTNIENLKEVDVTSKYMSGTNAIEDGVEGSYNTFDKVRENDGIYTLTVSARDYAGRETVEVVTFSVNRFGSVYLFDEEILNMKGSYVQSVDTDFVVREYNADKLVGDSVKISITRDGSLLEEVKSEGTAISADVVTGESGWYQYEYKISKDNFKQDGVYVITLSSKDEAGNSLDTIVYDELYIRFAVDTTKPELVTITGLEKSRYNANSLDVTYQLFDAVGIKELTVYVNNKEVQKVADFEDRKDYKGFLTIKEGMQQKIRFEIVDMAGNVTDSDNKDDIKAGKVASFTSEVTVSTNFFIRLYSNKVAFYGCIVSVVGVITGGTIFAVRKRKKR